MRLHFDLDLRDSLLSLNQWLLQLCYGHDFAETLSQEQPLTEININVAHLSSVGIVWSPLVDDHTRCGLGVRQPDRQAISAAARDDEEIEDAQNASSRA